MRRVDYIIDLAKHFKSDPLISPIVNHYVFVKSDYRGLDEDVQFAPSIWLVPLACKIQEVSNRSQSNSCSRALCQFLICSVVRNVFDTRDNFGGNSSASNYVGAYPEASDLEDLVLDSIQKFNLIKKQNENYGIIKIEELLKSDQLNGALVLPILASVYINI